jgi:glycosyltransferase involved in cell wall biosynthesis
MSKTRIVHIINSFEYGGAEAMLCDLLLRTDRTRFEPSVVALIDDLTVAEPVRRANIPLVTMGMTPGIPDPRGVARLAQHLRRLRPHVIHTWMDHSNLIGGVAARLAGRTNVVWGVHHSDHVRGVAKRSTLMTVSACAMLSRRLASRIVCCSEHARVLYARRGFAFERLMVIPNGFDTTRFRPDPAARRAVREELGVDDATPLVGLVARFDPCKDHATFLRAAASLRKSRPDVRYVLCGANVDRSNRELTALVGELGLNSHLHLLGPRRDVPRVLAAIDVLASSSISEAFPLAVGEAMSCAVPCVVTDVGDSALIVGPTGRVVPPRDSEALSEGLGAVLSMPAGHRRELGHDARKRIVERFDLTAVTRRYEDVYDELASAHPARRRGRSPTAARPSPVGSLELARGEAWSLQ